MLTSLTYENLENPLQITHLQYFFLVLRILLFGVIYFKRRLKSAFVEDGNELVLNFAEQIRKINANLTSFHFCTSVCLHASFLSASLPVWFFVYTFFVYYKVSVYKWECLSLYLRVFTTLRAFCFFTEYCRLCFCQSVCLPVSGNVANFCREKYVPTYACIFGSSHHNITIKQLAQSN
jgi:hypothetical protein